MTNLQELLQLFGFENFVYKTVLAEKVPAPYHNLLVHSSYMTTTLENYYQSKLTVKVLKKYNTENIYARNSLLILTDSKKVVEFAILKIDLTKCSDAIRKKILLEQTPVGRILVEENIISKIKIHTFIKLPVNQYLREQFSLQQNSFLYGRHVNIFWNNKLVVDVLEILS